MQRVHLVLMVVCLGLAAPAAAGDLWINCEAGLEIFLDGEAAGSSENAEYGKLIRGVAEGDHTIRLEKEGFIPLEFSVSVGFAANQVVVGALSAKASGAPSEDTDNAPEEKQVGMIVITSDPMECNVKLFGLRIPKIKPVMTFPSVSVGEHKLFFESSGLVLSAKVVVQAAQPAKVMVDFRNQRVAIAADTPDVQDDDSSAEEELPQAEPECIEYWIEVLRTDNFEEIAPYQQSLKELGFPREHQKVVTIEDDGALPIYKLRVGPVQRSKKAKWAAGLIRNAGIPNVWILPEECDPSSELERKREFRPTH